MGKNPSNYQFQHWHFQINKLRSQINKLRSSWWAHALSYADGDWWRGGLLAFFIPHYSLLICFTLGPVKGNLEGNTEDTENCWLGETFEAMNWHEDTRPWRAGFRKVANSILGTSGMFPEGWNWICLFFSVGFTSPELERSGNWRYSLKNNHLVDDLRSHKSGTDPSKSTSLFSL